MITGEVAWTKLALGADAVQLLLPHRRPFLLVDRIDGVVLGDKPMLRARKWITANEPVLEGHFPGFTLWPGVYTIEGLGQTTNLLTLLRVLLEGASAEGVPAEKVFAALRAVDRGGRGAPRQPSKDQQRLFEALGAPRNRIGYAGAIDVKLIEPVFAGCVLEYRVALTRSVGNVQHHEVEARVDDRPVARGSITSAIP